MRTRLLALLSLSLLLAGCGKSMLTLSSFDGSKKVSVKVEIADSPKEREVGLMNRTSLADDEGMLFVFAKPETVSFWMKNTLIPLEIVFFDPEGNFINTLPMQPCKADPCPVYPSAAIAGYALEVSSGFRERTGIGTGWKLDVKQVQKMSKPT